MFTCDLIDQFLCCPYMTFASDWLLNMTRICGPLRTTSGTTQTYTHSECKRARERESITPKCHVANSYRVILVGIQHLDCEGGSGRPRTHWVEVSDLNDDIILSSGLEVKLLGHCDVTSTAVNGETAGTGST